MKLSLLVIRCRDLMKTKGFYEQLGFVFVGNQPGTFFVCFREWHGVGAVSGSR